MCSQVRHLHFDKQPSARHDLIVRLPAYSTFAPALQEQQAERRGEFKAIHEPVVPRSSETALSDAIRNDLRDARKELSETGGFAWGIRQAIFGKSPQTPTETAASSAEKRSEKSPKS